MEKHAARYSELSAAEGSSLPVMVHIFTSLKLLKLSGYKHSDGKKNKKKSDCFLHLKFHNLSVILPDAYC